MNGWSSFLVTGLLALALVKHGKAQEPATAFFDHITTADGLSYDKVRSIIQDRKGFIWIGTLNGLNRYDGHRFKTFYHLLNDSSSLPDNRIIKLFEDKQARIWLCTFAGISRYDPVTEKFTNYFFRHTDGSRKTMTCYDIREMNGVYWVASVHGLCRLNLIDQSIESIPGYAADDFINTEICYKLQPCTSHLWVATFNGLIKIDPAKGSYERVRLSDGNPGHEKADNQVSWVTEDDSTNFWVGTWSGGLKKFDRQTNSFSTYLLTKNPGYTSVYNIARNILAGKEQQKYLWVASAGEGLFRFDKQTGKFFSYLSGNSLEKYGVPAGGAFCLFEDNRGRLWIGGEHGIYLLDPAKQLVKQKKIEWFDKENCESDINSIYQDPLDASGNTYWIGTYRCGILKTDSSFSKFLPLDGAEKGFQNKRISTIDFLRDKKNNLWIACGSGGIYMIDKNNRQVKRFETNFRGSFRKIVQDGDGTIWIRNSTGLLYFDSVTNSIKPVDHPVLNKVNIIDIETDPAGNLWILRNCSDDDVPLIYKREKGSHTITSYTGSFAQQFTCLDQKTLNDFYVDENNFLWLATSAGLIKATVSGHQLQSELYPRLNEKPGLFINRIQPFDTKYLWLSSNHGILLFNKNTGIIEKNLTPADGLFALDLITMLKDNKRQIFIPGIEGEFNIISAGPFTNSPPPTVVLTGIRIFNQPYLVPGTATTELQHIHIDYRQNNLQFEFAALDYTNPGQQQFAYKLEGFNKDWIYTDQAFAVYNNLSGGKYTFHIKAANGEGIWNNKGISIDLTVIPPFWTRSWFIFIVFTIALLTIFLLVRRHIRNIRKEARLKQMSAEAEMTALRAQMNPHFIFNCMNTIDAFILKNKQEEASDILQKFSRLIRQVLENSGNDNIFLSGEIETVQLYIELEEYILEKRFTHSIHIDNALFEKPWRIPAMIIQPYVENAILHGLRHKPGKDGHLQLNIYLDNSTIICEVIDNGIGRKAAEQINSQPAKTRQSMGMNMTQKRIDTYNSLHQEKIEVKIADAETETQTGTKVIIYFYKKPLS